MRKIKLKTEAITLLHYFLRAMIFSTGSEDPYIVRCRALNSLFNAYAVTEPRFLSQDSDLLLSSEFLHSACSVGDLF